MPSGPSWFWFASRWQKWLWKRTKLLRDDIQWDIIFGLSCIKASLRTWMHIWEFGGAKKSRTSVLQRCGLKWYGQMSHLVLHKRSSASVAYSKRTTQAWMLDPHSEEILGLCCPFLPPWLHPTDYQQAWPFVEPAVKRAIFPDVSPALFR